MSAAIAAGFICSRPRCTQLQFGPRSRPKRNAPALITNDLLASFRNVDGFCQMPIWHIIAHSYLSVLPHLS
jgi:hypothetical protein